MQTIIDIVVFVLILGTIIMVHELGHFIAAKSFGVYCSEFSLGMGPSIWHTKKGETEYHLRALPIGGFVAMAGEADQEELEVELDLPIERTLKGISTPKKVIVMAAGVIMNFILAFLVMFSINLTTGSVVLGTNEIGGLVENGVASEIGLQTDDEITHIYIQENDMNYSIENWDSLGVPLSSSTNNLTLDEITVVITIDRDGTVMTKNAVLPYNAETQSYQIGVYAKTRDLTFIESIKYAAADIWSMSTMIFDTLTKLVTDSKNTISQLSGPAGIYQATSEITQTGNISTLFLWMAMLSVNIGVFNLLPIPGLDGSQILFALVERIMGREIPTKLRYALQMIGLFLVFGLMILVTIQDITRIF